LPPGDLPFEGIECVDRTNPKSFVNFDLLFGVADCRDKLVFEVNYNRDLYEPETIRRWLGHFKTLLEGIAADAQSPVSALPWLRDDGRRRRLVDWNDTAMAVPPVCLHALFEARVAEKPAAVARVAGQERLTYAELNR